MFDKKTTIMFAVAGALLGVAIGWGISNADYTSKLDAMKTDNDSLTDRNKAMYELAEKSKTLETKFKALKTQYEMMLPKNSKEDELKGRSPQQVEIDQLRVEVGDLRALLAEGAPDALELQDALSAAEGRNEELSAKLAEAETRAKELQSQLDALNKPSGNE